MAKDPWNDSFERFKKQLDAADQERLESIKTFAGLESSINSLGRKSSALGDEKNRNILHNIMGLMRPIATVADTLAPGVCMPSSSIWGAFGLIMEV
jgi:hypothetical protein